MTDLTAIRQRAEAATSGPWRTASNRDRGPWLNEDAVPRDSEGQHLFSRNWKEACANAAFIAHARTDIPYLLNLVGELGEALAKSQQQTEELGRLNAVAEDALTDRIDALERALVTARTALEAADVYEYEEISEMTVRVQAACPFGCAVDDEGQHASDCKRQRALVEIAWVLDAEPCKHERWVTEVEWSDPKYQSDYWKPAKRRTTGSVAKQDVFCARCGITADQVTP